MRIFLLLFLACIVDYSLAQINEAERVNEDEVVQETKFFEASQAQLLSNYEEAIEKYMDILKRDPENDVVHFQLSRCYEALKDYDQAIKYGQKAIEFKRDNAFYYMQLAESYEAKVDFNNTASSYYMYTTIDPKESFFYERAVFFYLKEKNYDQALEVLDKMDKNLGPDESISHQKFEIYSKLGEEKKAIKELLKLSKSFPNIMRYKLNLANYYVQLGDIKKADHLFKEVLKDDPKNSIALQFLNRGQAPKGKVLTQLSAEIPDMSISLDQKLGKLIPWLSQFIDKRESALGEELIETTQLLIENYPMEPKAHAMLGDIYFNAAQYDNAIVSYEKTLSLNGSIFDVWYQLMVSLKQTGQIEKLKIASDNAILRFPNQGIAYLFHGYALNKLGESNNAFEILQEAMLFVGQNDNLRRGLKTEMARSKYIAGDYDAALKIISSETIGTADSFELYGDIHYKLGNSSSAKDWWDKALEINPKNENLRKKRDEMNG